MLSGKEEEITINLARLAENTAAVTRLIKNEKRTTEQVKELFRALQLFREGKLVGVLQPPISARTAAELQHTLSLLIEEVTDHHDTHYLKDNLGLLYLGELVYWANFPQENRETFDRQIKLCERMGIQLPRQELVKAWKPPYVQDERVLRLLNEPVEAAFTITQESDMWFVLAMHEQYKHFVGNLFSPWLNGAECGEHLPAKMHPELHRGMLIEDWQQPALMPAPWKEYMCGETLTPPISIPGFEPDIFARRRHHVRSMYGGQDERLHRDLSARMPSPAAKYLCHRGVKWICESSLDDVLAADPQRGRAVLPQVQRALRWLGLDIGMPKGAVDQIRLGNIELKQRKKVATKQVNVELDELEWGAPEPETPADLDEVPF